MAEPTSYIVLRRSIQRETPDTEGVADNLWVVVTEVPARSAEAAIRDACSDLVAGGSTYVAVPARSWKPVKVAAVQTTILKLDPT